MSLPPGGMTAIAEPQRNGNARRLLRRRPPTVHVQPEQQQRVGALLRSFEAEHGQIRRSYLARHFRP